MKIKLKVNNKWVLKWNDYINTRILIKVKWLYKYKDTWLLYLLKEKCTNQRNSEKSL
jgi:hypothetical protein